jgi:hypothetical protein
MTAKYHLSDKKYHLLFLFIFLELSYMSFCKRLKIFCCYRPNLEEDFMHVSPESRLLYTKLKSDEK